MHPLLNIALKAARKAGNVIMRYADRLDTLSPVEKRLNDFVTEVDKQAESIIIQTILQAYPQHAILSEETGAQGENDYCWIIDPLDGTTNYIHGFPHFAISIGVSHKGRIEQGLIFDPVKQETFMASRGEGARLNDRRIRVSKKTELQGSLLGTGFTPYQPEFLPSHLQTLQTLFPLTAGIRRAGAASLDLAYVAAGRLDGFWELGLSPWDIAAGSLLVLEAGGMVSDTKGGNDYLENGNIIAGNLKIFKAILQAMHAPQKSGG
jgi:myo-inositol-1(or 4)-monophosphatase